MAPGEIVAAHSNHQRHGKGRSLKAHDIAVAFVCGVCHDVIDGGDNHLDKHSRDTLWHLAVVNTLVWVAVHHPEVLGKGKLCRK
jgi:hypothetical protein